MVDESACCPKTQQDSDIRNGYNVTEYVNKILIGIEVKKFQFQIQLIE